MPQDTVIAENWAESCIVDGLSGRTIDRAVAKQLLAGDSIDLLELACAAGKVRQHYFGRTVSVHILENARSGACPEDCGYCGQSHVSDSAYKPYAMKPVDELVASARAAQQAGAYRFCMAISGRGPSERDVDHMCDAISQINQLGLRTCLSAGLLDEPVARRLREAGLDRLNHNLNTAAEHHHHICTTHTYEDRMNTLRAAREAGLGICSGLIVGLGETYEQLLDIAYTLRNLRAESIPVNFLLPIEGNRLNEPRCNGQSITPSLVIRVLSVFRFVNPSAEIRIAAGREHHLRSLGALALWPANSLFADGYLLTEGDKPDQTLQMIRDAGFEPRIDPA